MSINKTNREKLQEIAQQADVKVEELTVEQVVTMAERKLDKRKEKQNRLDNELIFEVQKELIEQQTAEHAQRIEEKQAQQMRHDILTVARAVAVSNLRHDNRSNDDTDNLKGGWAKELITAIYDKPSQQPGVIANANTQDWLTVALKDIKQLGDDLKKQVMNIISNVVTEICKTILKPQLEKAGFKFEQDNPKDGLFKMIQKDGKPASMMDTEKWQNAFLGEFTKRLSGLGVLPVPKPSGATRNPEEKDEQRFSSLPNPFKTTLTRGNR